jgi:hypothetical protein
VSSRADDDVNKTFLHLPRNLRGLIKYVGFAAFTNMDDDEKEVYDRIRHGHCMTCEGALGKHANFIVTRAGIVGGYCSGVCHSDMAVMGFLQTTHDDITAQIRFRGNRHPQADSSPEIPDTLGDDPAFSGDE